MKEPKVQVGILSEPQIEFILLNSYHIKGKEIAGRQVVTYVDGQIRWQGHLYDELLFEPMHEESDAFELLNVTIGINFHWERKEDQRFMGALKIIVENEKADRDQCNSCGRLPDQCHLIGDECNGKPRTAEGPCSDLKKLVIGPNS